MGIGGIFFSPSCHNYGVLSFLNFALTVLYFLAQNLNMAVDPMSSQEEEVRRCA